MTSSSVKNLVNAACQGDKQAYTQLMDHYYKPVYILCYGYVGNQHDAEEIAQETFMKGFSQLHTLREADKFASWIRRIAKNLCLTLLRRKKHAAYELNEEITADDGEKELKIKISEDIQWALERLPAELRIPLIMYYFEEKKVQKVAELMNVSKSNIYLRLRTALNELRIILTGDE